jgi:hypothetical protein
MYLAFDWCDIFFNQILCSLYVKTFIRRGSCDVIL